MLNFFLSKESKGNDKPSEPVQKLKDAVQNEESEYDASSEEEEKKLNFTLNLRLRCKLEGQTKDQMKKLFLTLN